MRSCFKPLQEVWLKWSFVLWSQPVSILLQFLQRAQVDCPKNKINFFWELQHLIFNRTCFFQKGPSWQSCWSAWKISGKIIILYTIDNQDADHFCRFSLCFSASTRMSRMFFFSILWKFITKQAFRHHFNSQGSSTGAVFYPHYMEIYQRISFS